MKDRTVKLQCPTCDRRLKVSNPKPNKSIVCPKCNARFRVDAQLRVVVDSKQNELFGPPVNAAMYDDARLKPVRNVQAAFEDIDHLFASGGHLKSAANNSRSELPSLDLNADPAAAGASAADPDPIEEVQASRPAKPPATRETWAQRKKLLSKSDERFQRNGIGLLILAIGLAMLPFFGRSVEGLEIILPLMPWAALSVAMVGCFMLAWSMRRGKLAAVILCALPLLLIGLVSVGGHFLNSWSATSDGTTGFLDGLAANVNDLIGDGDPKKDGGNDELAFDPDEITNNATSKFVPPRNERPLAADRKPVAEKKPAATTDLDGVDRNSSGSIADGTSTGSANNRNDSNQVAASKFRPAERTPPPVQSVDHSESGIESELRQAGLVSTNTDKRNYLEQRTSQFLTKGLVDRGAIRSPNELGEQYNLSATAGEQSVYGIATFSPKPISGFDVAYPPDAANNRIDLLVPIVGAAEFPDSIAPSNRAAHLTVLKFNIQDRAIVGVQGQFSNPDQAGGAVVNSQWFGRPTSDDRAITIQADGRPVHGVVLYRNQLELVGVAMILGRNRSEVK